MNVTLCSAFRNASGYIPRYFAQLDALEEELQRRGDFLALVFGYGDSVDDTGHLLRRSTARSRAGYCAHFVEVNHGGPDHGSVVNAERFANMAKVWNEIWRRIPDDADAVIFVEADLIWEPATMLALLDDLEHVPAVAPKIILRREGYHPAFWYDNWGFWRNGVQISVMPPYFADSAGNDDLLELDSAGSCIVMRGDVARGLCWPPEDVVRGVCRQIREQGDSIWLDAQQTVVHP